MKFGKALFYWTLVAIWMGVIFYFSGKTSVTSDQQSYSVIETINQLFRHIGLNVKLAAEHWNFVVRKLAHISEYAVLGSLLYMAFSSTVLSKKKVGIYSLLVCIMYAVTDEIHQLFISGRTGKLSDIGIDAIGGLIGVTVMILIRLAYKGFTKTGQM